MTLATLTPLKDMDDSTLIQACQQKQPDAFNTLMNRYLKLVYSYIFHTVQHTQLAEDLTQETFLRVYRALGQFQSQRPFKPWLFTIATNVCKTAFKQQQKNPILLSEDASENNLLENIPDLRADPENISDTQTQQALHRALEQLNPNMRQALILRHVYDLPYEDVAKTLDTNINTIRTWLKRGRETLKAKLEQKGGLDSNDTSF